MAGLKLQILFLCYQQLKSLLSCCSVTLLSWTCPVPACFRAHTELMCRAWCPLLGCSCFQVYPVAFQLQLSTRIPLSGFLSETMGFSMSFSCPPSLMRTRFCPRTGNPCSAQLALGTGPLQFLLVLGPVQFVVFYALSRVYSYLQEDWSNVSAITESRTACFIYSKGCRNKYEPCVLGRIHYP